MAYTAEERETIVQISDVDENWNVYTRQRKVINKLKKLGYKPSRVETEGDNVISCEFSIPINKITFRNANTIKRTMSDDQKEQVRERFAKAKRIENKSS